MKFLFPLIAFTLSTSAMAMSPTAQTISAENMASYLSDSKVAPCLARLQRLEKKYDVNVGGQVETRRGAGEEEKEVVINYDLIEGGDMVMGSAEIVIKVGLFTQFGFPEGGKSERVTGCKFSARQY